MLLVGVAASDCAVGRIGVKAWCTVILTQCVYFLCCIDSQLCGTFLCLFLFRLLLNKAPFKLDS